MSGEDKSGEQQSADVTSPENIDKALGIEKVNSAFGKALFDEAARTYRKDRQDQLVASIKRYMQLRTEATRQFDVLAKAIDWYNRKLLAIEQGQFEFGANGELIFSDPELNRANY